MGQVTLPMSRWTRPTFKELQGVVDRALQKTETLREMLARQDLTYFQLDPDSS